MKQFISFVRKEFYHIFRDLRTMLILLGMPVMTTTLSFTLNKFAILLLLKVRLLVLWLRYRTRRAQI